LFHGQKFALRICSKKNKSKKSKKTSEKVLKKFQNTFRISGSSYLCDTLYHAGQPAFVSLLTNEY
jgi:hypothetical protein